MITVDELKPQDLAPIEAVLKQWVRDGVTGEVIEPEIKEVMQRLSGSLRHEPEFKDYLYLVARDEGGKAIGVMGIRPLTDKRLLPLAETQHPAEFINAYIDTAWRGQGVGGKLLRTRLAKAKELGYTEVLIVSGSRYSKSGWPFHTAKYGEPIATFKDYFGPGSTAKVWCKNLD
jgi:predicted N-acetyltransferase YhbS